MLVSISTMPAREKYLEYAKQIESFADFLHLDVCDGEYNSTKCFSPEYAKNINENSTIPIDCHLMTKQPLKKAKEYIKAGVNIVTAQIEAFETTKQIEEFIEYVKTHNTLVGISLELNTEIKRILPYLDKLDIVLVMSVQTGKSGQKFNDIVLSKIEYLAKLRVNYNYSYKIEVDGGITDQTAQLVKHSGADIVVSGNYVYNSHNKQESIEKLR